MSMAKGKGQGIRGVGLRGRAEREQGGHHLGHLSLIGPARTGHGLLHLGRRLFG